MGFRIEYFPHPRFGVTSELKGFTAGEQMTVFDVEVGGTVNLFRHLSVFAGYRYMSFDFSYEENDIGFSISGPIAVVILSLG